MFFTQHEMDFRETPTVPHLAKTRCNDKVVCIFSLLYKAKHWNKSQSIVPQEVDVYVFKSRGKIKIVDMGGSRYTVDTPDFFMLFYYAKKLEKNVKA